MWAPLLSVITWRDLLCQNLSFPELTHNTSVGWLLLAQLKCSSSSSAGSFLRGYNPFSRFPGTSLNMAMQLSYSFKTAESSLTTSAWEIPGWSKGRSNVLFIVFLNFFFSACLPFIIEKCHSLISAWIVGYNSMRLIFVFSFLAQSMPSTYKHKKSMKYCILSVFLGGPTGIWPHPVPNLVPER